jgi:hypothetical protein
VLVYVDDSQRFRPLPYFPDRFHFNRSIGGVSLGVKAAMPHRFQLVDALGISH